MNAPTTIVCDGIVDVTAESLITCGKIIPRYDLSIDKIDRKLAVQATRNKLGIL